MFVKNLGTFNFQGLKGVQNFDFEKITALAQPNGSGKTSLINALRYGLTGIVPKGDMVTRGEVSAAVKVTLENGSNFSRQAFVAKGKSSKYYISNQPTTATKLNEFISSEMGGIDNKTARMVSSGGLLTSMTSQDFGELLLRYLPETMTAETVINHFSGANEEQKKIIKDYFLDSEFEIDKLKEFQQVLKERRDLIKQRIENYESFISMLGDKAPEFTKEELEARISLKTEERDELLRLQANLSAYNQLFQQEQFRQQQLQKLEAELANLKGVAHSEDELKLANQLLVNSKNSLQQTYAAIEALVSAKKDLDLAIENISKPVCPLSDKIVCTVDKTPVLKELEEKRNSLIENYQEQRAFYKQTMQNVTEYENKYNMMLVETQNFALMQEKMNQRDVLLTQKVELPEKPEDVKNLNEVTQEIQRLQSLIPIVDNYSKKETYLKNIEDFKAKLRDYQELYVAFSPKGEVKEKITSYYLDEFAEPCNQKASKLFPGMNLKFITENGVKVLTDPDGSGKYLEFASLSGGEQASVMFLLVSMLSSLSGMGVIILDELSVLDKKVFNNLVRILKDNSDEYDMCLIALVDHTDMIETLEEYHIPILDVNKGDLNKPSLSQGDNTETQLEETKQDEVSEQVLILESNSSDVSTAENELEVALTNEDSPIKEKSALIGDLKDMMAKTLEETAETRFVPTDEDLDENFLDDEDELEVQLEETEDLKESLDEDEENHAEEKTLESIGLSKGKSHEVVKYMIENSDKDRYFYGTAKEISEALNISQPTISKVVKKLQDAEFAVLLKRGVWELSESLFR